MRVLAIWLAVLTAFAALPAQALAACCQVTVIDAASGVVTGGEAATGRTFRFTVTDTKLRATLRVGTPLDADFQARTVSVTGSTTRFPMTSVTPPAGGAGTAADAGTMGPAKVAPPALEAIGTQLLGNYQGTIGGQEGSAFVLLSGPAREEDQHDGAIVALSSANTALVKPPMAVLVPKGKPAEHFTFITGPVAAVTEVTLTATYRGVSKTTTIKVLPGGLARVEAPSGQFVGGAPPGEGTPPVQGKVKLNGPPPTGGSIRVNLVSSNPKAATVPASITIQGYVTEAPFDITTLGVAAPTPVQISASSGDKNATSPPFTVVPAKLKTVGGTGCTAPCVAKLGVELSGTAPPQGVVVRLESLDPSWVQVPPTVTIPAGATQATFDAPMPKKKEGGYPAKKVDLRARLGDDSKHGHAYVWPYDKPDLKIASVTLVDRFGNAVPQPTDSQPFKLCMVISTGDHSHPIPATVLRVDYLKKTGAATSAGRQFDIPLSFQNTLPKPCIDLAGLDNGESYDVKLHVDPDNTVSESHNDNNRKHVTIAR